MLCNRKRRNRRRKKNYKREKVTLGHTNLWSTEIQENPSMPIGPLSSTDVVGSCPHGRVGTSIYVYRMLERHDPFTLVARQLVLFFVVVLFCFFCLKHTHTHIRIHICCIYIYIYIFILFFVSIYFVCVVSCWMLIIIRRIVSWALFVSLLLLIVIDYVAFEVVATSHRAVLHRIFFCSFLLPGTILSTLSFCLLSCSYLTRSDGFGLNDLELIDRPINRRQELAVMDIDEMRNLRVPLNKKL